jgi:hypothetical protein
MRCDQVEWENSSIEESWAYDGKCMSPDISERSLRQISIVEGDLLMFEFMEMQATVCFADFSRSVAYWKQR